MLMNIGIPMYKRKLYIKFKLQYLCRWMTEKDSTYYGVISSYRSDYRKNVKNWFNCHEK